MKRKSSGFPDRLRKVYDFRPHCGKVAAKVRQGDSPKQWSTNGPTAGGCTEQAVQKVCSDLTKEVHRRRKGRKAEEGRDEEQQGKLMEDVQLLTLSGVEMDILDLPFSSGRVGSGMARQKKTFLYLTFLSFHVDYCCML